MSVLTLIYDGARPILKLNGQVIDGLQVVVVEHDRNERGLPVVQIELIPNSEYIEIKEGVAHWVVGCPICEHNSVHSCDISTGEHLGTGFTEPPESYEDRTVSGEVRVVEIPTLGKPGFPLPQGKEIIE